ncbi:MAG TPA: ATP-binding protein [Chitinophagales bacterium]|nr:ATP-binding protein [Chitinophagales bacterium]
MNKIKLDQLIFAVLIFVFVFIAGTAVLSFSNLKAVVENINTASSPNLNLLQLESLTSDLSYAESSVKSYNLTRDIVYLEPYLNTVNDVNALMDSILVNASKDKNSINLGDSLEMLVTQKLSILESILALRNNEGVTEELNRINSKLAIANEVNKKIEKSGKVFKGKEERKKIKEAKIAAKPENVLERMKTAIGSELVEVKSDQLSELKDIKLQELKLLKEDRDVMAQIRSLIFQLQEIQKQQIVKNTLKASELTAKTYRIIFLFCVLGSLLMLGAIVVIVYYIRKSKSYTEALKAANVEIESFAKAKETFLYNVSHELRTPLNAVIGFSEQLDKEKDDNKRLEITQIIYKSAQHLKYILNDILDYSKLNAGKFILKNTNFNLPVFLKEISLIVENNSKQKGLDTHFEIEGELPEYLSGDVLRLRQIFLNIIDNAIKYTNEGQVTVFVKFNTIAENQGELHVKVKDSGIGMSEADLKKIFNAFEQASTRASMSAQGTGLGLSITKQLIEMQSGTLNVESEVGLGSTFEFMIPYQIQTDDQLLGVESESLLHYKESLSGAKILAVDDVHLNLKLVEYILSKYNVELTLLEDGHEVMSTIENNHFDLVLLDLNLNGISGKEICEMIRKNSNEDVRNLPVIAVSATHQSKETVVGYGFDDVLGKPYTESQLLKVVHQYFSFEEILDENTIVFDKSHPSYNEILEKAKPELMDCANQLKENIPTENTTAVLETVHRLIPILHLLGNTELKDEVLILEAILIKNQDLSKSKKKLQQLQDKLNLFSKSL